MALAPLAIAAPISCGSPAATSGEPADSPDKASGGQEAKAQGSAASSPPASDPAAPAPSTGVTAGGASPAATPSAAPAEKTEPPPEPISDAERKELQSKCGPLQRAMQKIKGSDPEAILAEALQKPPKMPAADLERCSALLSRSVKLYVAAAVEVEAKLMMTRLVKGMVAAYQEKRALCPSSERPVPADLARLKADPYTSTAADWETPSWKCLGFSTEGQAQRFQYEVKSDPGGKKFTVIARGFPHRNGPAVELVQEGSITDKGVEVAPPARR